MVGRSAQVNLEVVGEMGALCKIGITTKKGILILLVNLVSGLKVG